MLARITFCRNTSDDFDNMKPQSRVSSVLLWNDKGVALAVFSGTVFPKVPQNSAPELRQAGEGESTVRCVKSETRDRPPVFVCQTASLPLSEIKAAVNATIPTLPSSSHSSRGEPPQGGPLQKVSLSQAISDFSPFCPHSIDFSSLVWFS